MFSSFPRTVNDKVKFPHRDFNSIRSCLALSLAYKTPVAAIHVVVSWTRNADVLIISLNCAYIKEGSPDNVRFFRLCPNLYQLWNAEYMF